jgi:hypothetical protein
VSVTRQQVEVLLTTGSGKPNNDISMVERHRPDISELLKVPCGLALGLLQDGANVET